MTFVWKYCSLWEDWNLDRSECFCTLFIWGANGIYENWFKRDARGKPCSHAKLETIVLSVGILHMFLLGLVLSL